MIWFEYFKRETNEWQTTSLFNIISEPLAEILENFEWEFGGIVDKVIGEIEEKVDQALEYNEGTDWSTVDSVAVSLEEEANEFAYDVQDKVTRGLTNVEYVLDEIGNR